MSPSPWSDWLILGGEFRLYTNTQRTHTHNVTHTHTMSLTHTHTLCQTHTHTSTLKSQTQKPEKWMVIKI